MTMRDRLRWRYFSLDTTSSNRNDESKLLWGCEVKAFARYSLALELTVKPSFSVCDDELVSRTFLPLSSIVFLCCSVNSTSLSVSSSSGNHIDRMIMISECYPSVRCRLWPMCAPMTWPMQFLSTEWHGHWCRTSNADEWRRRLKC